MFVCFWQSRSLPSRRLNNRPLEFLAFSVLFLTSLISAECKPSILYPPRTPSRPIFVINYISFFKTFIVLKITYIYIYKYIFMTLVTWLFHSSEEVGYFASVFSTWEWSSLAPGLCQTVLEKTRVLQLISCFHTRPEELLQHQREPREYSHRYCRPSQHTLYPPSSGAEKYNKDLVVIDCFEFSDPCLRVVLSTNKRSKVLSTRRVSVFSNFLGVNCM